MKDQVELPDSLGRAFEHIRALHATLAAVMLDISALRHIVLRSPKLSSRYHHALASESVKTRAMIEDALRSYDEEIARLKCRGPWKN
jgi:hypothetical protein